MFEEIVGEFGPVGGHAIFRIDSAEGADVFVGTFVAHHTHAADGEQDRECLPGTVVEVPGAQFADEYLVDGLEAVDSLRVHSSDDTHRKARPGKRMARYELFRQAKFTAHDPDLVLEQFAERFDQLQSHLFGQAANVVVAFNGGGGSAKGDTFDHVRI